MQILTFPLIPFPSYLLLYFDTKLFEKKPKVVKYYVTTCFIISKNKNIRSICAVSFDAVSKIETKS